ncbi:MAG TPA: FAD-dependent oxidoreductase [Candidatus Limnocylindrales bacterium]|nr:FAD-dependent oxidoreductase [Candidatus Limnocylindrales bacterium]
MTSTRERVVIVGASLAGATVAGTLRDESFEGRITLVGEEPHPPYERPTLSKGFLRGEEPIEAAHVHEERFYADADIDRRFGVRAERVDASVRRIDLATGERLPFDTLVVATGGTPRRPPIPGIDLRGVHTLRTVDDATQIRNDVFSARRVVVVGMGFIGSEVTASLRQIGVEVTAIDGASTPLAGAVGPQIGRVVERMHRDHGVRLVLGDTVARFDGADRVERVVTSRGRTLEADVVIVGLGMQPNVSLVLDTPIRVDDGIVVDAFGRTSVAGIFAAGDVARHWHPTARRHLRVEHWNNAVKQGAAVARAIVGAGDAYDPVHFFWSEQYGRELQYYGLHEPWDDVAIRGDVEGSDFVAIYTQEERVVAAAAIGRSGDLKQAKRLIAARALVPRTLLRDEDVRIDALAPPRTGIAA